MAIANLSRYQRSDKWVDKNGFIFLDIPATIDKAVRRDEFAYTVREGDTLFTIAYLAYRDMDFAAGGDVRAARLWSIIAELNDIVDATAPLIAGRSLRIPSEEYVRGTIKEGGI